MEIFFGTGKFGERFLQSREVEDRIVAKAAGPSGRLENKSIHAIADDGERISFSCYCQHTNEMRGAVLILFSLHGAEKFCDVLGVSGVRSRIAGRANARLAAERGNDQPGIICAHCFAGNGRRMQCFADGIFREGGSIFGKWRKFRKFRQ